MGKTKKSAKGKKTQTPENKYTVDDLLSRVEEYVDCFQFELAIKFCEKALEIEPANSRVIETAGNLFAEIGDIDSAKNYFLKAVEVDRDHGHEKYMYLGQMAAGNEAKAYYLKGIEIMKNSLKETTDNDMENNASIATPNPPATMRDVSNAYCALAEIFLTDSCEEEEAEKNCHEFAKMALSCDDKNPDAYIVMASFLLSKDEKEEATTWLSKCFDSLNLPDPEPATTSNELEENDVIDDNDEENDDETELCDDDSKMASYSSRFTLAKLLVEVDFFEKAETVLLGLIKEDEEDVEVWYMLGWIMFLQENIDNAEFFLAKASELYEKLQHDDEPLLQHLNELLEKCKCDTGTQGENGEEMETE